MGRFSRGLVSTREEFTEDRLERLNFADLQSSDRKMATLLNWLSTRTDNLSFFEVSRRTEVLLLLASGRRVHDLTLLKILRDFLVNLGDEIILWTVFGSKRDRASFRQSGWKLSRHPDIWLCPVTWIRAMLKRSEERRKKEDIVALFITVVGTVRAASKTIIAGWVRSARKDADIDASPGSIRSAVGSRGWLDDLSVQDILDRKNWKSVETFRRHYCRKVQGISQRTSSLLSSNFTPI